MITTVILPINWQTKHLALKHTGLIWRSSILAEKIPIIPPLLVNDKLESDFKNKVHYFNVCFASKCTLLIKLVSTIFYIFNQMIALQKLWKIFFISPKKLFLSQDSNFCNFFHSFPHFPDSKWQMKVEQFMMSWTGLHKLAGLIFGITQKLFYITSSNFVK